jgi:hypothetical protein
LSIGIKVYQTNDFIRKTAQGRIDLARSLEGGPGTGDGRQLFQGAQHPHGSARHRGGRRPWSDALHVAAAFATHFKSFRNKIALIIPDTAERMAKAEFMRTCMHLQGFQWEFFMAYEDAIDWLSEITEL